MRKLYLLLLPFILWGCDTNKDIDDYVPAPVGSYAKGADISWLTEQEHNGFKFYNDSMENVECMLLLRNTGMNAVRFRVWVNPSKGYCNLSDVLVKVKRANDLGLRIMIDFHYSDNWADPGKQYTPEAWKNYTISELCKALEEHTTDVLSAIKEAGVNPEWVQIGNETRNGMLWPVGQLWDDNGDLADGWKNYAKLSATGYDAAKKIFPQTNVIVHIDNAYQNNNWYFRKLKQNGGKFDMIGLSHYPMAKEWSGKDWDEMNRLAEANIILLYNEFHCPIMMCEIGTKPDQEMTSKSIMKDIRARLDKLPYFKGFFYWEPQCYNGWASYGMGSFNRNGQPNEALRELWK